MDDDAKHRRQQIAGVKWAGVLPHRNGERRRMIACKTLSVMTASLCIALAYFSIWSKDRRSVA